MFHMKHGKDGYMTLRKLFEMCTNCNERKFFKVMICGYVEVLPTLDGLENTVTMKFIILESMEES